MDLFFNTTRWIKRWGIPLLLLSITLNTTNASASPNSNAENSDVPMDQKESVNGAENQTNWRKDPSVRRRPGSYLGGGAGYNQQRAWFVPQDEEYNQNISMGPIHSWQAFFRVGDAFFEWFAVGFQVHLTYGKTGTDTIAGLGILLDTTLVPWRGLGLRPSVGLGFNYATGEKAYEFGFGGPGIIALAATYEIRITKLFVIAPVIQTSWIFGEDFNGLSIFFGLEFLKWFKTATG